MPGRPDGMHHRRPGWGVPRHRAATRSGKVYITSGGADRATPYTFSFSKPLT